MNHVLQTERLLLREFITDDADFIIELVNTPDWITYIGDRNVKTTDQAIAYLTNGPLKSYALHGYGLYLVALKPANIPIGMCGILKRQNLENPDIGFAFLPQYYGNGFGYEIASATLKHAKEKHKLTSICAIVLATNKPSIRLILKLGLQFEKNITLPGSEEALQLYS